MVLSLFLVKKRGNPLYLQTKGEHSYSLDTVTILQVLYFYKHLQT